MSSPLAQVLAAVAERLAALASQDEGLRIELRRLAAAVLAATEATPPVAPPLPPAAPGSPAEMLSPAGTAAGAAAASMSAEPPPPLPELTLGRAALTAGPLVSYPLQTAVADLDLADIEARCRLKAEGARWAATRRRLLSAGANYAKEIEPRQREVIAQAKAIPNCFLWMCHPDGPTPADLGLYEQVAVAFDIVADGIVLLRQMQESQEMPPGELEGMLDLLAEAQSILRVAVAQLEAPPDTDQNLVFRWLKATANENQIYIQRYMRIDDPGDPAKAADLQARIEAVDARWQESRRRTKQRKKLLSKVRHKATLIAKDPAAASEQWPSLAAAVQELVADGLPASNRELRELLLPAIDHLPEQAVVPPGLEQVLREIDRFLAASPPPEATVVSQPAPAVEEAARLLAGRSLVLIGGDRRPAAYRALKEAFALRELIWIETRDHESIEGFAPYIARPDVAAVLLAIRWSSHSYGDAKAFCERHAKPLIRLPGGYNPNQVAVQIMSQSSERLKREG